MEAAKLICAEECERLMHIVRKINNFTKMLFRSEYFKNPIGLPLDH
jgi:hypothetical protein